MVLCVLGEQSESFCKVIVTLLELAFKISVLELMVCDCLLVVCAKVGVCMSVCPCPSACYHASWLAARSCSRM